MSELCLPNFKDMPMLFQEYCSWYFNKAALEEIYGLSEEMVLPKMHEIASYAIEVEGYKNEELYVLCLEQWKDEGLLLKVAQQLNIDLSFPNIKQTVKTICRWIISQHLPKYHQCEDYITFSSPFFFKPEYYDSIIKDDNFPKEYREIFTILGGNWYEIYSAKNWIKDEVRVVELAKKLFFCD